MDRDRERQGVMVIDLIKMGRGEITVSLHFKRVIRNIIISRITIMVHNYVISVIFVKYFMGVTFVSSIALSRLSKIF